jgi:hypothetical protein
MKCCVELFNYFCQAVRSCVWALEEGAVFDPFAFSYLLVVSAFLFNPDVGVVVEMESIFFLLDFPPTQFVSFDSEFHDRHLLQVLLFVALSVPSFAQNCTVGRFPRACIPHGEYVIRFQPSTFSQHSSIQKELAVESFKLFVS